MSPTGKSGKHYMNPSVMKDLGDMPGDPENGEDRGQLAHVEIHPKKEGGFHVHGHYHHAQKGHHVVSSEHATKEEATAAAGDHLGGEGEAT